MSAPTLRDRLIALADDPDGRWGLDAIAIAAARMALLYALDDDRTPDGEQIGSESGDMMEQRIRALAATLDGENK